VAEVAYAVGFKSVAHFSNAFFEQNGVRPSSWRQHAQEKLATVSATNGDRARIGAS
jgi:AraC-like DNA-binding protein